MFNKCKKGEDCCCNCKHQKKLMCHPGNQKIGKASITSICGWACTMEFPDGSNKDKIVFFDSEHGLCEMYEKN